MISLPVDRTLTIYGSLADRSETKGVRDRLSKYLLKRYIEGEKDEHRLTVEGLSYLRNLYGISTRAANAASTQLLLLAPDPRSYKPSAMLRHQLRQGAVAGVTQTAKLPGQS